MAGLLHFLSAYFLLLYVRMVDGGPMIISSCSQTPYPQVCNYFVGSKAIASDIETQIPFRERVLTVTKKQAKEMQLLVSAMDFSSMDERTKLAWEDCLELYESTIDLVNRSINSINPVAMFDAQTWLSAAIANQQTCIDGFTDFNSSSELASLTSMSVAMSNLSKLLSNSLAISKAAVSAASMASNEQVGGRRLLAAGFPTWLSAADRKLLRSSGAASSSDIVVARDGSGNYKTISEAVAASVKLRSGTKRFVIRVKAGVYQENVEITTSMKNLMIIGDGIDATIVTGSKNVKDGSTTFRSATFAVSGDGFIARDMTFQNTAGPQKHQAVALRSSSDGSVFHTCSFKGYQDTLYVHRERQFYRNCDVYGTVDFIFGDAIALLQNCNIYVRRPMSNQANIITAQGRSDPAENTGISIHNSQVMAAPDLRPVQSQFKTYLGRPWREYSRTVFMKTSLDSLIDPEGWSPWNGDFALTTLYYGEYMNTGSGASTSGRLKWPGYRVITSAAEANQFTVGKFLGGDAWIPSTGVPYTSGL